MLDSKNCINFKINSNKEVFTLKLVYMQNLFLVIVFSIFCCLVNGQTNRINEIAVSQLFLKNNTTILDVYYGARAKNKAGHAWSYGINANYSIGITKEVFANVGLGYFNQRFGISRGFEFYEPNIETKLFYTTKDYSYQTVNYFGGIGYRVKIKKVFGKILPKIPELRFSAIANLYYTFQQIFEHDFGGILFGNPNPQVRKDSYQYGNSIHLKAGIAMPIYKKFKIGIDLVMPVYSRLHKDVIFKENPLEYHNFNFSIGTSVNLIYGITAL
jgi:hypothetical protein